MSQTPIETLIESADAVKQRSAEDKKERRNGIHPIMGLCVGLIAAIGGGIILDRNYSQDIRREKREEETAEIVAGKQSLQLLVDSIESDLYTVEIVNGIDWPDDPNAKVKVTLGNCSGEINLFQSMAYDDPSSDWVSDKTGGKDNLLAIPDEFGEVMGYLTLTKQNILDSFPESCTTN